MGVGRIEFLSNHLGTDLMLHCQRIKPANDHLKQPVSGRLRSKIMLRRHRQGYIRTRKPGIRNSVHVAKPIMELDQRYAKMLRYMHHANPRPPIPRGQVYGRVISSGSGR